MESDPSGTAPAATRKEPTKTTLDQQEATIRELTGRLGDEHNKRMELENRLATLEGRLTEQSAMLHAKTQEPPPDPFALSEEALDEVRADPAKLLQFIQQRESAVVDTLAGRVAAVIADRETEIMAHVGKLGSTIRDASPEYRELLPFIKRVKENPRFAKLGEEAQMAVAQELLESAKEEPDFEPLPSSGGRGAGGGTRESSPSAGAIRQAHAIYLRMCGGNEARANRMMTKEFGEGWNDVA